MKDDTARKALQRPVPGGDDRMALALLDDDDFIATVPRGQECDNCGWPEAWAYNWLPGHGEGTWEWLCAQCWRQEVGRIGIHPQPWSGHPPRPQSIHEKRGTDGS